MSYTVMVVDDEADVRAFLTAVLEKEGYTVVTAENGGKALALADEVTPDLICLDLQMPDHTGTDFYRRLMKHPSLGDTPVIVVSGLAGRHLAVSKPFAVFDKPIVPEEFIETVERALGVNDD